MLPPAVIGYVLQSFCDAVVTRDAAALTTVTVAEVEITRDGSSVGASTPDARRLLLAPSARACGRS